MKLFAVILTICVLRACRSEDTSTTTEASTGDKIYSGKYPSHTVIKLASRNILVCEGVLIAKNYVLTVAGCVHKYKSSPKELEVVVGLISTENMESDKNAQTRKVSNVIIHQEWFSSKHASGDIAILKVSPAFNTNKYVDVSAYAVELLPNDTVRVVGYGDSENLISNKLRAPPAEECNYVGGSTKANNTDKFCAKNRNEDGDEEIFWQKSFAGAPILLDDADKDVSGLMSVNYNAITYVKYYAEWIEGATDVKRTKNNRVQSDQSKTTSPTTNPTTSSHETTTTSPSAPSSTATPSSVSTTESSTATTTSSIISTTEAPSTTTSSVTQTTPSTNSTGSPTDNSKESDESDNDDDDDEEKDD